MTRASAPAYPAAVPRAAGNPSARARRGTPAPVRELRARGRNTRRRLLDAGAEAFATKGYHATRVDDIVKLAETSHGTFYLYFANKEELLRALAGEVGESMNTLAESLAPLRPGADGRAALRTWIEQFADLYEQNGAVIRTWTQAEMGGTEFGKLGTDVLAQFTRVLAGRVAEVAPADLDPMVTSLALVAMLERLNFYVLTRQVPVGRTGMIDVLARVTHASLFGS
jgi:AcrR family transcriptional regulator